MYYKRERDDKPDFKQMKFLSRIREENLYFIAIIILSIVVNIYIHFPEITNKYSIYPDVGEHYYLYQLNDSTVFQNDLLSECRLSVYSTASGYQYLVKIFTRYFPLLPFLKILPILLSIVSTIYIFKIGKYLKDGAFGFLVSYIFLLYVPTMDTFFGGLQRSFGLTICCIFLYFIIKNNVRASVFFVLISALFYPTLLPQVSLTCVFSSLFKGGLPLKVKLYYIVLIFGLTYSIFFLFYSMLAKGAVSLGGPLSFQDYNFMLLNGLDKTYSFLVTNTCFFNRFFNILEHSDGYRYFTFLLLPLSLFSFFIINKEEWKRLRMFFIFIAVSVFLFFLLEILFPWIGFKFRYPSRQIIFSIPLLIIFTSSYAIYKIINKFKSSRVLRKSIYLLLFVLFIFLFKSDCVNVVKQDALFDYVGSLPVNSMIAGEPNDLRFIPLFTKRKVLVISGGIDEVFHKRYFSDAIKRTQDLFRALYSDSMAEVKAFCEKYKITHFIINENCYTEGFFNNDRYSKYENLLGFAPAFVKDKNYVLLDFSKDNYIFKYGKWYVIDVSAFR